VLAHGASLDLDAPGQTPAGRHGGRHGGQGVEMPAGEQTE
jgi:hypothetical protein